MLTVSTSPQTANPRRRRAIQSTMDGRNIVRGLHVRGRFGRALDSQVLAIRRVATVAVNMLMRFPSVRVIANPLIGPVPNWKSRRDATSTVRLESTIALADNS